MQPVRIGEVWVDTEGASVLISDIDMRRRKYKAVVLPKGEIIEINHDELVDRLPGVEQKLEEMCR